MLLVEQESTSLAADVSAVVYLDHGEGELLRAKPTVEEILVTEVNDRDGRHHRRLKAINLFVIAYLGEPTFIDSEHFAPAFLGLIGFAPLVYLLDEMVRGKHAGLANWEGLWQVRDLRLIEHLTSVNRLRRCAHVGGVNFEVARGKLLDSRGLRAQIHNALVG